MKKKKSDKKKFCLHNWFLLPSLSSYCPCFSLFFCLFTDDRDNLLPHWILFVCRYKLSLLWAWGRLITDVCLCVNLCKCYVTAQLLIPPPKSVVKTLTSAHKEICTYLCDCVSMHAEFRYDRKWTRLTKPPWQHLCSHIVSLLIVGKKDSPKGVFLFLRFILIKMKKISSLI